MMKITFALLKIPFALLLLAVPLAAQDPIIIPQVPPIVEITVEPTPIEVTVEVMTDSAMIANLNRNLEALRIEIAAQECNNCGGASTTTKIAVGVLVPVLFWIALELRGIKNNSVGLPGAPGQDGADGKDGVDGLDGSDGADGKDGKHQYWEEG